MNKFKITVETKSRSKVVIDVSTSSTEEQLREELCDIYNGSTITIKNTFFNTTNVNYIQVEKVE
ncbi:MAG: hypothetical protein ACRCVU_20315 [Flavobacterium sp.]